MRAISKLCMSIICSCFFFSSCKNTETESAHTPKLTVVITVDQMGQHVLKKYRNDFKYGLKTLIEDGDYFQKAFKEHAITNSLPGHTSIATGMYPKNHGINDNLWSIIENDTVKVIQPMADSNYAILGIDSLKAYEPKYLQAKALTEYFQGAYPDSKIASIGSGRSSALHMGKAKGICLWYEPNAGRYITSTYFNNEYPEWLNNFNNGFTDRMVNDTIWNLKYSINNTNNIPEDNRAFEHNGENYLFPHISNIENENHNRWFDGVPALDKETTSLAIEAVSAMEMGKDEIPDFLSLTYSMIDHIGHQFGPFSLEQYENLMSLDEQIGRFLNHLDAEVGKGNYTVILTADHGSVTAPEQIVANGGQGFRISNEDIQSIYTQIKEWEKNTPEKMEMQKKIVELLESKPFIARVFTENELKGHHENDSILTLYQNSFIEGRTPLFPIYGPGWSSLTKYGITVMAAPNTSSYLATSIHGTPYNYDREVPIIFYGNLPELNTDKKVRTIDIAPTILKLNNIKVTDSFDGKSLF